MFPTIPSFLYKLIGFAAALAIVAAGAWYQGHHNEALKFDAYRAEQKAAAARQVASNVTAVSAISASEAAGLRTIATVQQEQINDLTHRRDALLNERAQLTERLRINLARASSRPAAVPETASSAQGRDAAGGAALPVGLEQLVDWNTRQFYEADTIATRLTAAQAIIEQDRAICNGALPGIPK